PDVAQELIIAMGLGDKSLFDRLEECQKESLPGIPQEELLGYLEDSAEAIDFLNRPVHDLGMGQVAIQHCDIKPHNLMIVGGSVQVCDFGLARMMGSDRATTAAGSIAYAAPETLIENKPRFSTDQYSLAITYYELKTGKLPYQDDSLAAILDAKREATLDFSDLPDAEKAVLKRATLRNPDERYASCREMLAALRGATSGEEYRHVAVARRSLLPWVVAVLVLGAASGGAWFVWLQPRPFEGPVAVMPAPSPLHKPPPISDGPKSVQPVGGKDSLLVGKGDTDQVDRGNAYLERGTQALNRQDFVAAVPALEQAAKLMPEEAKVFSRLGSAWRGQKRWDRAVESYTMAIQIEHHPLDYEFRGQAYRALDKLDNAIADFHQSVKLDPKNAKAFAELCDIYLDKDDPKSAIHEVSEAIQICRDDPQANFREFTARHLRAYAYLKIGKIDEAAADLERVFDLAQSDQDRASCHELFYTLSVKFADAQRHADAMHWIKRAIGFARDEATRNTYQERLKTYSAASTPTPSSRPNP
ncbi:MAG: protein kinase domain-containing protein, partial [Thermoguttaceae bacterium]